MKTNKKLKDFYEAIYQKGEISYFSKFENGKNRSENDDTVLKNIGDLNGKTVLDVGCGTGALISQIAQRGVSKAYGIDYSDAAIQSAKNNYQHQQLSFSVFDFDNWIDPVDVIVSCGTFEHMDDPGKMMKKMSNLLKPNGVLILTCPHFYNIRGIIWITLQKLLNVPMSLTDVHSISPADMKRWSETSALKLTHIEAYDYERSNGDWMIVDLKKRLTNALRDAQLPNEKVDDLLSWLEDFVIYIKNFNEKILLEGANCLYKFVKPTI
jgi:2-polyprenyl-3-methyl-5-hydroxy-6-metoxy-1,4-benzoquinol methylase